MNRLVAAEFHLNFICLFVCFWLCWVFIATWGFSLVAARGALSTCGVLTSCGGFSSHGAWALGHVGSQLWWCMGLVAPWIWNLPRPGIEPVFPTLAGRLLTTRPPGKFHLNLDEQNSIIWLLWATLRQASTCLLSSHSGGEQDKQDASECCEWLLLNSCI